MVKNIRLKSGFLALMIGASLMGLAGCATTISDVYTGGAKEEERSGMRYIAITSMPSDAEIYLNDRLVGRTPYAYVPLHYTYKVRKKPYGLGYGEPYGEMYDNAIVRISKKGYKDTFETRFIMDEYHFNLEPEVSAQPHIDLELPPIVDSVVTPNSSRSTMPLDLDGIIYENGCLLAIINGKLKKIGEKIYGNQLIDIKKDKVILYDGEKNFELQLK